MKRREFLKVVGVALLAPSPMILSGPKTVAKSLSSVDLWAKRIFEQAKERDKKLGESLIFYWDGVRNIKFNDKDYGVIKIDAAS